MPPITTVEASGFIPEIWLATALGRLKAYLTFQRTVTMDTSLPTGETFNVGKTLHLPKRGTLTVNQKTEAGNFVIQNPQSSTVDLSLNHHPEVTFQLTSEVIAFQNQDQAAGYVVDGIIALAEDIDLALARAWRLIATANTINNASTITEANILSARKILRDNKIMPNARAYGVVSTANEAAMLQLTNLVRYDAIGISNNVSRATVGDAVVTMPGAIGRAYGFEICPSQLIEQDTVADNGLQTVTISATGGSFTITANALTTLPIQWNATAAQVQAALAAILGAGSVYVTGAAGGPYTIAQLFATVYALTTTATSLTGGAGTAVVAQVAVVAGAKNIFYTEDFLLMASRNLPLPEAGTGALGTVMTDPDTGITMRLVKSWNPLIGASQITVDLLYGFTAMRPEHGVLITTS